ncbi:aldo/keto reductase [Lactobacillus sp.]|uniref:aldo/keto reductase n=1 Tax=Lactobacillus sp. TaxID=1591 RepID=UPI0019A79619|nr:aldo/keto reductase [Lactobacillus sp.]MBD5429531.1 aldo/keto reductase [Lactobacillus sp.]
MEYFELNNGIMMPALGFGTYLMAPSITEENVTLALNEGYRLIDTAQNYGNEHEVGLAVNNSGIKREDIFITSKTQTTGYRSTKRGIDQSLQAAGLDYFDLMIIHWPNGQDIETYRALEDAYKEGKLRAIGLSNFNHVQIQEIMNNCTVKPAIDQVETHLYDQQKKLHQFLTENDIIHEAWSPLGAGSSNILREKKVQEIADKYGKSTAQILLRFLIQEKIVVIPKSTNLSHIKSNIDVFDFKLDENELQILRSLDRNHSFFNWPASMSVDSY